MRKIILGLFYCILIGHLSSQVKSGPMLGYNSMKEVAVWIQLKKECVISFEVFQTENQKAKSISKSLYEVSKENGYTIHCIASNLEPGTTYSYVISQVGNDKDLASGKFTTQTLWQHRSDPPDFSFATGSCTYSNEEKYDRPGEPYGQSFDIFSHILNQNPRFMLWLGDNIYLREADWNSKSGIYHRYTHFKSKPELQALWKGMHHYAIWDDHDFGPNDADRSFVNKQLTFQAFKDFWANPSYGINGKNGITSQFSFNDIDFFLLDNRYYRSPNNRKTGERAILGEEQIEWLIDALINSKATFKVVAVGGQLLSDAAVYENHATFPKERERILELIEKEDLKNIIFFSGDRHKTELSKMEMSNGNVIYDFTCSPLTSKAYNTSDESNTLRVKGTHVSTQNFGIINVSGSYEERKMTIILYDGKGEEQWKHEITKQ